jgi:hypothetical protein
MTMSNASAATATQDGEEVRNIIEPLTVDIPPSQRTTPHGVLPARSRGFVAWGADFGISGPSTADATFTHHLPMPTID